VPHGTLTAATVAGISETFHEVHKREYGVSSTDFAPALVSLGVTGTGRTESPPAVEVGGSGGVAVKGERPIYFNGEWHTSKVYDGHALKPDASIDGPCIVEYEHACAVLPPNSVASVDRFGNLVIDISRNIMSNV